MRELKFRAWDTELKHMIVDSPISMAGIMSKHIRKAYDPNGKLIGGQYVVMQFTELRDNKRTPEYPEGQEVYDGDICRGTKGQVYQIVWLRNHAKWGVKIIKTDSVLTRGLTFPLQQYVNNDMTTNIEVIGNIYENPELLRGE